MLDIDKINVIGNTTFNLVDFNTLIKGVEYIEGLVFTDDIFMNVYISSGIQVYIIDSDGNTIVDCDKGHSNSECLYNALLAFNTWLDNHKDLIVTHG